MVRLKKDIRYKDKKWLEEQYLVLKKSPSEIAKEVGCNNIPYWLKKFGIPRRGLSEALKGRKYSEWERQRHLGPKHTKESRSAISKKLTGRTFSEETHKKMSLAQSGKFVSEETKKKISKALKGRPGRSGWHHTEEAKIKIRNAKIGSNNPNYGKTAAIGTGHGHGCYFIKSSNEQVWLRSSYELQFAIALEQKQIKWEYEKRIELHDDIWHPDFYLPEYNLFIETKSFLNGIAKRKMTKFSNEYPDIKLLVLEKKDIDLFLYTDIDIEDVGMLLSEYLKIHNKV